MYGRIDEVCTLGSVKSDRTEQVCNHGLFRDKGRMLVASPPVRNTMVCDDSLMYGRHACVHGRIDVCTLGSVKSDRTKQVCNHGLFRVKGRMLVASQPMHMHTDDAINGWGSSGVCPPL